MRVLTWVCRAFGRCRKDESGSAAVTLAFSMPLLVAGAAFGVETSYWYYEDLQMQAAADAAAYAAAIEKRAGSKEAVYTAEAKSVAAQNGYEDASGTAQVFSPPKSGKHKDAKSVEVILQETKPRYFTAIFLLTSVTVNGRAVATYQDAGSACILALHKSASKAALFSGSSTSKFKKCSVMANSSASDAVTVQGSAKLQTSCIYSAGGVSLTSGATFDECKSAQTNLPVVADPYADLAVPTASGPCRNANGATLQAGSYCSGMSLSGTKTLQAGVYVISGGDLKINANANISGSGVVFYLTGGARVSMNGNATVKLSAATSGTYSGILFFGDRTDTGATKNTFNGTASSLLTGAIYFASQNVQFNGNFSGQDGCTQVVGLTVEWSGNADVSKDCSKYGMRDIAATQIVKLVE